MKSLIIIGMVALSTLPLTVNASDVVVLKSCSTVLSMPGESQSIKSDFKVLTEAGRLSALITQTDSEGHVSSYSDIASIVEQKVRAGLNGTEDSEKLNLAENLITHAIMITEDPIMEGTMSAGLDLRKVRSAKVYTIGEVTNMGLAAIVEAKDESGKNLGSFFGGFLVSPCK